MSIKIIESRDIIRDSNGVEYSVISNSHGMKMVRFSPYDLTDYCYAIQVLRNPYSDDYEDVIWKIYSPNGRLLKTVNDIGWDALADILSKFNDGLGLSKRIDRT